MRIEFNHAGFDELRTSAGAHALLKPHVDELAERANAIPSTTSPPASEPYYEVYDDSDSHRARYRVVTASGRAIRHEAKTNALQRSI